MGASHISTNTVTSSSAKKAAVRRAVRKALNIYGGKTRPTLKALAYLGGFPVSRLYQLRWRRKHNGGGRRRNGGNGGNGHQPKQPSLADMLASASPSERAEAGRKFGIGRVWDELITPVLDEERTSQQAAK
jgi:hypothetical protein